MSKKAFFFSCLYAFLFSTYLTASTIPQYEVDSIVRDEITLTSEAIFQAHPMHLRILSTWDAGDELIFSNGCDPFFDPFIIPETDPKQTSFMFTLHNMTKNSSLTASLNTAPQAGSLRVSSINAVTREIVLSDTTEWSIHQADQARLNAWKVNDLVLIGKNAHGGRATFDALLLNATGMHCCILRAKEL